METALLCQITTSRLRRYTDLKEQHLERAEARRIEEIGSKIRSQRLEAEERKKEREVKFTDRLPPPKRSRTGGCRSSFFARPGIPPLM